jgi:hypothetical protein
MVWIVVLLGLVIMPIVVGAIGCMEVTIALEFNLFNSPFYKIGVFSERYTMEDGTYEHQVAIGLLFMNVVIVFWKEED